MAVTRPFITALVQKCVNDMAHLNFQKFPLAHSFWFENILYFSELLGCLPKIMYFYFYFDKFFSKVMNVRFSKFDMKDSNSE
jgi:hypothetical protein